MLELEVEGKDHSGWLTMGVQRNIDELIGSFDIEYVRRGQANALIRAGDLCTVTIRDLATDPKFQVIQGFVIMVDGSGDANGVKLSASGSDRTNDMVHSAVTRLGEWKNLKFEDLVADLASDFNISVAIAAGLDTGPEISVADYDQGTTYADLIAEYAQQKQLLVYTLNTGEIFITRASDQRGSLALIEGGNIINHSMNMDWSNVFSEYIVKGSRQSQDNEPEMEVTQVEASATDSRFPRNRSTIITPDTEINVQSAQGLADWHSTTRLGKAESYQVQIPGWHPVLNELAYVKIGSYDLDADMLISGYALGASQGAGKSTTFNIVHPRAYAILPDNKIVKDPKDSDSLNTQ